MLKNYFKTAFRNLVKNKTSSVIYVFGLTIGLTCCLLIALYIQHELSYDKFQQKGNRIARVIMEYSFDGKVFNKGNFTSVRVAPVFTRTFPEVESAIIMTSAERVVSYQDKLFTEKRFVYADSTFFTLFSFRLLSGNANTALTSTHTVLLTESMAKKYFGHESPVGKALKVANDSIPYQVTGVIENCPSNSQIKFDFVASFSSLGLEKEYQETYWDANYTTYLLLRDQRSINHLQAKLPAFMKKEMEGKGAVINFYLEPFNRIHLYSPYAGFEPNNSVTYIYILAAVALLILIIACSTYINLSTARSIERAKEVGVRKVIGADKKQLFLQFIGESGLICLLAVICSLVIAVLLLPSFNQLANKQLAATALLSIPFISFSLLVAACITLLAGTYPALILSGFQPVKVLKGSFKNSGSGQWLRKSLIVFQFVISVFLITATFIMQQQLYFIQHKNLGYERDHVLILPMDGKMLDKISLIKLQLTSVPGVISASRCVRNPVEGGGGYNMRSPAMPENEQVAVNANPADEDFVKTTGMQLVAGSAFSEQDIKDAAIDDRDKRVYHFILNESAAKQLGWSAQEAVGKKMFLDNSRPGFVKGVVKDFHFESMHTPIKPFVIFNEWRGRELLVKLSGDNLSRTITSLEAKWKELIPYRPFEYRFMDNDYAILYSAELRLGTIMRLFSGIAIVLACLGLFGLSAYAAQQRIKEMGIRKVLGASAANIVMALSSTFIRLSVIAMLIAFPLSWWAMTKWLQDFSYKTSINWIVFPATGLLTLLLALITVSVHTVKTAMANPVKSLRTE